MVWVEPEYRRHHIAAQMMTALEEKAKTMGYKRTILQTREIQSDAVRLYTGRGYGGLSMSIIRPMTRWMKQSVLLKNYNHSCWPCRKTGPFSVSGIFMNPARSTPQTDDKPISGIFQNGQSSIFAQQGNFGGRCIIPGIDRR